MLHDDVLPGREDRNTFCCRGHGTQVVDGKLMATLCGVIEVQPCGWGQIMRLAP